MSLLIVLFLFLIEIYTAFLIIFLIVKAFKRKKLPWVIIAANGLCIALLLWLKYMVENHEVIFTGSYKESEDWGEGLANLGITLMNVGIILLILLITQLIFAVYFTRRFRKLNACDGNNKTDDLSF